MPSVRRPISITCDGKRSTPPLPWRVTAARPLPPPPNTSEARIRFLDYPAAESFPRLQVIETLQDGISLADFTFQIADTARQLAKDASGSGVSPRLYDAGSVFSLFR